MPTERPLAAGGTRPRLVRASLAALVMTLGGCATQVDVRPMATGRVDASAYELNGADVHTLRREAQRLCPLGGEILREAGHSLPPEAAAGRWRSTLNTLSAWVEPLRRPAQLVVACREPGDRFKLQAAVAPQTQSQTPTAPEPAAEWTAALPVGPINPEW